MIWYSIRLSNGWEISAFTMKSLYYQVKEFVRSYVGNINKGDYKSIYGTVQINVYKDDIISTSDIGFIMCTSCSFYVSYYKSMTNNVFIRRGVLKND